MNGTLFKGTGQDFYPHCFPQPPYANSHPGIVDLLISKVIFYVLIIFSNVIEEQKSHLVDPCFNEEKATNPLI